MYGNLNNIGTRKIIYACKKTINWFPGDVISDLRVKNMNELRRSYKCIMTHA